MQKLRHVSVPLIRIDEVTGHPHWGATAQTKAEFVLQAASSILAGDLSVELIEPQIVAAANETLRLRGQRRRVRTIHQVQKEVSATAAMWYHEIKRVSSSSKMLEGLVRQGGHGLTKIYREIGPSQYHPPHGRVFSDFAATRPNTARRPDRGSRIQNVIEALMAALDKATPEHLAQHDSDIRRGIAGLQQALLTVRSAEN